MNIISIICSIIVGIAMFVTPIFLLIFLIRWAMKKAKKKLGIATLICAGCFILFTIIGTATAPSTYCNHEYQLVSSEPPTCEKKGLEMYHCNLCDTDRKNKLNKLGHDMKEVSHKESTYDVGGEIVYQCTRCEKRDITVIKKLKKPKETNPSAETIETVVTANNNDEAYIVGDEIDGNLDDIVSDGIVEKLCSFGFAENEATEIREIFLKCGLDNINQAEPTDPNATIDGLVSYRVVMDKNRTAWFTIDNRKMFYIALNGIDVYDIDKGGFLININDVHVPESEVTLTVFDKLKDIAEPALDGYFVEALYYDAWGVARSDDKYMIQCEAYAKNKLGVKDWIPAKVWFDYDGENYNIEGIVIDGVRYK